MADVTDAAFRRLFGKYGKPDVMLTEFVSVDGLLSKGREQLLTDFWYSEAERPIVAQIFGAKPDNFEKVATLIHELGFDGIDINMGCPDKSIEKQGGGAALIKNPQLAAVIIRATKRGAHGLPVSVKTRIGYSKNMLSEWLPVLLQEDLAALTVHLRTRKEMSKVAAHWELASEIVALKNQYAPDTILLGNGDVQTLAEAREKCAATGLDGVMIGRGAFGQPWFFADAVPPIQQRLSILIEHAELFEQLYLSPEVTTREKISTGHNLKRFETMKKHFKAYATGFDGAKELRMELMEANTAIEVRTSIENFFKTR